MLCSTKQETLIFSLFLHTHSFQNINMNSWWWIITENHDRESFNNICISLLLKLVDLLQLSIKSRWIDLYRKALNCDLDLSDCKDIRFSASLSICRFSSATGLGSWPEFFYFLVLSIVIFVEISAVKMSSVTVGGSRVLK